MHRRRLQRAADLHLLHVLRTLVCAERLDESWVHPLLVLTQRTVRSVQPSVRSGDAMDIRSYLKIKTIGSSHSPAPSSAHSAEAALALLDPAHKEHAAAAHLPHSSNNTTHAAHGSYYVDGVVFRKTALQPKRARTHIPHPRVLLLGGGIEYERVAGKYVLLETLLQQEAAFLQLQCQKIIALRPDVVVVVKSVAGVAQRMLCEAGVVVLCNVKRSVVERLARVCEAPILPSTGMCTSHLNPSNYSSYHTKLTSCVSVV